jgi:hypothetical protein
MNIFVSNLHLKPPGTELAERLRRWGRQISPSHAGDDRRLKGFGFIEMQARHALASAIAGLNGKISRAAAAE